MATPVGWGAGAWGSSPWGSGTGPLQVLSAFPVRENLVRITFSAAPYYSRDLDQHDASDPKRFSIVPVAGSVGADGKVPRPVSPCRVDVSPVTGSVGSQLDVWVDRMMSPYPSLYLVACNGLVAFDGTPLDGGFASSTFFGLHLAPVPNDPRTVVPSGDMAQPDSADDLAETGLTAATVLGSLPVNTLGDYAADHGLTSYRKRVRRVLITRKDSVAHLPGYGVGTLDQVKRLATVSVRAQLAAEAEEQVGADPDTLACSATLTQIVGTPVWVFAIRCRTKNFGEVVEAVPVNPGIGSTA